MQNIYACSDLHGKYNLWKSIKNYLKNEDTLIFLGDAIDRGPDGLKILYEIMKKPNTIYLCGNHEDMMSKAIRKIKDSIETGETYYIYDNDFMLWIQNGGNTTLDEVMKLNEKGLISLMYNIKHIKGNNEFTVSASNAGYYVRFKPNTSSNYISLSLNTTAPLYTNAKF